MKIFIKILKELKGEFTIKDLKLVVKKYMPMGYWEKIEIIRTINVNSVVFPLNISRKDFDIWIIKYIKNFYKERPNYGKKQHYLNIFILLLKKKAQENTLFVEFLDFTDIKKIEKNIKIFLNKFKRKYTKKFLEKEIDKFIFNFWKYDYNYNSIYMRYEQNYKLEKEPFGLNKIKFNIWIIEQIKNYYYKNLYINKIEIYIQFLLAFIKRAETDFIKKNLICIIKKLKRNFKFKIISKLIFKFCPNFIFKFLIKEYNDFFVYFQPEFKKKLFKTMENFVIQQIITFRVLSSFLRDDIYYIFFIFYLKHAYKINKFFFKEHKKKTFIKSKIKNSIKYIVPINNNIVLINNNIRYGKYIKNSIKYIIPINNNIYYGKYKNISYKINTYKQDLDQLLYLKFQNNFKLLQQFSKKENLRLSFFIFKNKLFELLKNKS